MQLVDLACLAKQLADIAQCFQAAGSMSQISVVRLSTALIGSLYVIGRTEYLEVPAPNYNEFSKASREDCWTL